MPCVANAAITCRYGYDLLGRLTNLTYATVGTSRVFRQWHDVSGAVTQRSVTVNNNALFRKWDLYAYDSLGRLSYAGKKSGFGQVFSNRFGYDPAGNRLSVSTGAWASAQFYTSAYAYADNRLVSVSTNGAFASAVLHDAAGNVTGMVSRAGVRLSLAWDTQGQLVSVATNGAPAESYAYDPLGRRVRTASGTNVVFHVYDGGRCAADTDASGNPLRVYTWGPGIDDLLAVTAISGASTSTCYAVKDHLGSVCALVTAAGAVVASYTYDAWGNVSATINYSLLPVNFSCRFLFHGGWHSEATDLCQFRARWYSPDLGRWLSPDPIGLEGGLNLYEFCGNDPVNVRDPSGQITLYDVIPGSGWMRNQRDSYLRATGRMPEMIGTGSRSLSESQLEREAQILFQRLNTPGVEDEFHFDSWKFWDGFEQEMLWCYEGKKYRGNDVNYIGIGMYEAFSGRSDPTLPVQVWKRYHYFESPSDDSLYWARKGYEYYNRLKSNGYVPTGNGFWYSKPTLTRR